MPVKWYSWWILTKKKVQMQIEIFSVQIYLFHVCIEMFPHCNIIWYLFYRPKIMFLAHFYCFVATSFHWLRFAFTSFFFFSNFLSIKNASTNVKRPFYFDSYLLNSILSFIFWHLQFTDLIFFHLPLLFSNRWRVIDENTENTEANNQDVNLWKYFTYILLIFKFFVINRRHRLKWNLKSTMWLQPKRGEPMKI